MFLQGDIFCASRSAFLRTLEILRRESFKKRNKRRALFVFEDFPGQRVMTSRRIKQPAGFEFPILFQIW